MISTSRAIRWIAAALAAAAWSAALAQPHADRIVPHRAVYALFRGDSRVGDSVFTLRYDPDEERYTFETRSEFRSLLLRLAAPRPIVEHSEFTIVDGDIRPLAFSYEDGTRGGRRNLRLRFDWPAHRLVVERDGAREELVLPAHTLDRASARIALMRDLASSAQAGRYRIADPAEIRSYDYRAEGLEIVTTAAGRFEAQRVVQQRPGSSRRTLTWAAPSLEFLPVRIEQRRDGGEPVSFELESVEWLSGGGAPARR